MSEQDPTADYRKYPKSPNFLGIVLGACAALLLVLAIALYLVHRKESRMRPTAPYPTPNSLLKGLPLGPAAPGFA